MITPDYQRALGVAVSNIAMRCNFHQLQSNSNKAIIVEGSTDASFINRIRTQNTKCFAIGTIISNRERFLPAKGAKGIILDLFKMLSNNPDFYKSFPPGCGNWLIYGLIDRDYDDETLITHSPRLFITDTHDIETLLLSTDNLILHHIKELHITEETKRLALRLSGQFAYYRQAIYRVANKKKEINIRYINSEGGTIKFSDFVEHDNISVEKLIKQLYQHMNKKLSNEKLTGLSKDIKNDSKIRKHININMEWTYSKESFSPDQIDDFWQIVHGHDITSAICFYDAEANALYHSSNGNLLNREFEMALIDAYDISKFGKTELYRSLKEADLVMDCHSIQRTIFD